MKTTGEVISGTDENANQPCQSYRKTKNFELTTILHFHQMQRYLQRNGNVESRAPQSTEETFARSGSIKSKL